MTTTTTTRQEYVETMKKKLEEWNREIDTLEGRISTMTGSAREKLRDQLADARQTATKGKGKLEEIQKAGESSWESLRDEADHLWKTLKQSVNYFRSQI